jgi:hypothetical protein
MGNKTYKFEVTLSEHELDGDEMWEDILEKTESEGVAEVTKLILDCLTSDVIMFHGDEDDVKHMVKLKEFKQ